MHAFILTTTDKNLIAQTLIERLQLDLDPASFFNQPDVVSVTPQPSLTIAQIRQLALALSRKPLKLKLQLGLIFAAEKMTLPAQNAFLKLLEEPGPETVLCLVTLNPYQLLPTILSRTQTLFFTPENSYLSETGLNSKEVLGWLEELRQAEPGRRLTLVETYAKDRPALVAWTEGIISTLEAALAQIPSPAQQLVFGQILGHTLRLHQALKANVNPKLALDNWALSL